MGMGAMVGTGVFVSIGLAAGIAGPAVILAIALAAGVAACNALSSAQLAANHPVSGGTYEYGYRLLNPALGFTAGWMFLCAKSASAATAALGFAGYTCSALRLDPVRWLIPAALAGVLALTLVVLAGMRRAGITNTIIVGITLAALTAFIIAGLPTALESAPDHLDPLFTGDLPGTLLHATALMFVAFTGYGRIATMGEEVRDPRRTIPRAIILTVILSAALYIAVATVAVGAIGAPALAEATRSSAAPLEAAARSFQWPGVHRIVAIGAITAMLGVLLNLILGLSRVLLAMSRRSDMPRLCARITTTRGVPAPATIAVGLLIGALAALGDIRATWSFSAFTVLIYYAITNLAALRLPKEQRLYHPAVAICGLVACLSLAFFVEVQIWLLGLGLIVAGLLWHALARRVTRRSE